MVVPQGVRQARKLDGIDAQRRRAQLGVASRGGCWETRADVRRALSVRAGRQPRRPWVRPRASPRRLVAVVALGGVVALAGAAPSWGRGTIRWHGCGGGAPGNL